MGFTKDGKEKKFRMRDYKGYIALLIGLFILLFALIAIAIGMIQEHYGADLCSGSKNETGNHVRETENESFETKDEETHAAIETAHEDNRVKTEDALLVLINKDHPILNNITYSLVSFEEGNLVDERMYNDLVSMIADAKKAGYELVVCSSWRSRELQTKLYEEKIEEYLSYGYSIDQSEELAAFWVAVPGTSEHEVGLAVDIVSKYYQELNHSQADTAEQKWLMTHCQKYGFILRYPENKQDITHIGYEPWHYRYVGKEAAKEIMSSGICLEEYLGAVYES